MAKKVILKDLDNVEILPITRGELIVDSSGKEAFHSNEFLATNSLPGLMSKDDKLKLDNLKSIEISDKKVLLIPVIEETNNNYRVLLSYTDDDENRIEESRKSKNLYFNPALNTLFTPLLNTLDLIPQTSGNHNLGTKDINYRNIFLSNYVFISAANSGIYLNKNSIGWHNYTSIKSTLLKFTETKLTAYVNFHSPNFLEGNTLQLSQEDETCQNSIFGNNNNGYRLRIIRQAKVNEGATSLNSIYSPILIMSSGDTHAYLGLDYKNALMWIGAGNNNKWNWRAEVLTSLNYYNFALPITSYTATDILEKLKTVDGHNSNLDADTLDGMHKVMNFTKASNIGNNSLFYKSTGKCEDVPSMSYAVVLQVLGVPSRRWQIWNAKNNHNLYWRPEINETYDTPRIILDSLNYKNYTISKEGEGALGTWNIDISGNATTASKWLTARTLILDGSVTGTVTFDGSSNILLTTTTNHTHTFASLTSKPTTVEGYGITDAMKAFGKTGTIDLNTIKTNGTYYLNDTAINSPRTYSEMLCMYNYDTMAQLVISFNKTGYMYYRGGTNADGYYSWRTVLDSVNYSSYALPLSGGTMSNTNVVTNLNADLLDGYHFSDLEKRYVNVTGDTMTNSLSFSSESLITIRFNRPSYGTGAVGGLDGKGLYFCHTNTSNTEWYMYLKAGDGLRINDKKVWYEDNDGSGSGLDADTLDGYHASMWNLKPWGTIPVISTDGYMDVGKHFEFHFDNTTGSDYSTILKCTGNYSNIVNLPSASGTLALTSQIPTVTNYYWANIKISDQPSTSTSPTFRHPTSIYSQFTNGSEIIGYVGRGNSTNNDLYFANNKEAGIGIITDNNISTCIYLKTGGNVGIGTTSPSYKLHVAGDIYTTTGFKKNGSSDSYVLLGGGGHKTISSIIEGGYIGTTLVLTSSKVLTLSGISSINGRLSISAESDLTRLGFGGPHTVVFGEPGYAHRNYIFRPSYGSNGVTYTSLIIQNASAAASPTFTTSHSFDYNGNAYHSGKVGIGTTSIRGLLDLGSLYTGYDGDGHYIEGTNAKNHLRILLGDSSFSNYSSIHLIPKYVGINKSNPSHTLDVAGDIYTTTGFKKGGSSDSYILLGGGGHKAISDFAISNHNHYRIKLSDDRAKYPGQLTGNEIMSTFGGFMQNSILGISNFGDYSDVLVIRSYMDSSGGNDNAIIFNKNTRGVWHTQFGFGSTTSWGIPYLFLDSNNFNKYTPTLTGTGASGTWGISITGNAATATNIDWGGVTNKPSSFTPSSHNHSFTLGATTITTGGTCTIITGPFAVRTNATASKAFSIYRDSESEGVNHWVDDGAYHILYTNDEDSSSIAIRLINTDTERATNKGANAKDVTIYLDCYRNFYPNVNNSGSIGLSGYKWANMYATTFHGSLDGNAALATKLKTACTLWGQSFDGTANVSGDLNIGGADIIGYNGARVLQNIRGNLGINPIGNVGIGTTSPAYKLHVVGDIYTTTGFKKNGSSNDYVLLGGGGHKAISDFSMVHEHPYLPLSGGTVTGTLNAPQFSAQGGGVYTNYRLYLPVSASSTVSTNRPRFGRFNRDEGSAVLQLGTSNLFDIVDADFSTTLLRVSDSEFKYKNLSIIHSGNIGAQSVKYASSAETVSKVTVTDSTTKYKILGANGTGSLSIYILTATIGSSAKPIYLSGGVPTECDYSFNGSSTLPIVLVAGRIYRSSNTAASTGWSFSGYKHESVGDLNSTPYISGGVARFTFDNVSGKTFYFIGAVVNHGTSNKVTSATSGDYSNVRSDGLYWFGTYVSDPYIYIRACCNADNNNDSTQSGAGAWKNWSGAVLSFSIIIIGRATS